MGRALLANFCDAIRRCAVNTRRMVELPPCWISSGPDHCPQPRVDIPLRNQLYSALRRLPSEQRALVVDVGANDGLFSLNLMHLAERVPPTGVAPLPAHRRATQPADSLARRISLVLVDSMSAAKERGRGPRAPIIARKVIRPRR